ncbi:MAG: TRAP transporter small permease [Rhodobacteraceae bacterium]|nr:TRAP transporter small permease [Paracoccaceae bacterium]
MRLILRATDAVNAVVTLATGLLLAVVVAAVAWQVSVRFVLTAAGINISAPWTEELARYALIWMVFLGAGVGVRHARMIALEFLIRKLPAAAGVPLRYAVTVISIAFFATMIWVGIQFVELGRTETSPVMNLRKSWVYWAMPVGAALMVWNALALVAETVLEGRDLRFASDHAPEE